ncbi:hypothetical protein [Stenotrophomonas maltophilia]|uniref:hypothetical protein n=1 Tax=Stenotrophomonas maltophilia TaxID=40324 RepID=UPI0012FE7786|nr:hypothetical protein [Stenotrophomonas maltophilia]
MSDYPEQDANGSQAGSEEFIRMRLAGGRFDTHLVPFDVLSDLAAYRELVVDLARVLFKRSHPNRRKVPSGFTDSFQLGIESLTPGNSVTLASRTFSNEAYAPLEDQPSFPFPAHTEFVAAREMIFEVIACANSGLPLPEGFPRDLASKFNRFGRNFRQSEFLELSEGGRTPVRYGGKTRKAIVLEVGNSYEGHVDGDFRFDGGRCTEGLIHLIADDARTIDMVVSNRDEWSFLNSKVGQTARITGLGLFDRQDRLLKITEYEEIPFGPSEPIASTAARLREIEGTPAGWYSDGNPAPASSAVASMRTLLEAMESAGIPRPYIYPLPEGGVVAEWSWGGWEISATVEPGSDAAEFLAVNIDGPGEVEDFIYFNAEDLAATALRVWSQVNMEESR